jgi:translocation and assembly module TamB
MAMRSPARVARSWPFTKAMPSTSDRIAIDRFRIEGRGGAERGGVLEATGSAEFPLATLDGRTRRVPAIRLEARARELRVSSRPDRRLTVSGDVRAALDGADFRLRGALRTDSALFILPDELAPSLGSDVVVRGTERAIEPAAGQRLRPDVQVDLDLGRDFTVRGQGLNTRLEGQLTLRSTASLPAPRLLGEVRTASGSYRSYGQQLTIETGVLRFSGPFDNPTLDITAVRPNTSQRVGVIITGSANAPRVRLFSEPDLPDSEKLAWLVLGRPASGAGAEAALLQQAAAALIAGGGDRRGGLAQAFGLDEVTVGSSGLNPDGSPAAAVTLGKRLTQDLYLSYERSVAGAVGTMSIFYDVTRRFTVRARAGEENALDLIFTLQFD